MQSLPPQSQEQPENLDPQAQEQPQAQEESQQLVEQTPVESSQSSQPQSQQQDLIPQEQSASDPSPEPESQGTEPPPAWPDPSGWDSISDLDVASLPEASHGHFNRLKELHAESAAKWDTERSKVETAIQELEEARGSFHRLMEQMDSSGETKVVAEELERFKGGFNSLASENITLAQRMFQMEHPNFERYPQEVRNKWAEEMADDGFYTRYQGKTIYDKMKEAWNFALFRSGAEPAPPKPPTAQVPDTMAQNVSRAAQGLVADGQRASAMPTPDAEDMSFDDILSLHDHLLKR